VTGVASANLCVEGHGRSRKVNQTSVLERFAKPYAPSMGCGASPLPSAKYCHLSVMAYMMKSEAKKTITCDNADCKEVVDIKKPKKDEPPKEGISAVLNNLSMDGNTREYHFCNEKCLLAFLKNRHSNASVVKIELDMGNSEFYKKFKLTLDK
jgi:hypothetical protein